MGAIFLWRFLRVYNSIFSLSFTLLLPARYLFQYAESAGAGTCSV